MKNEIKKLIYKQDPEAIFEKAKKGNLYYKCFVSTENDIEEVNFVIPFSDMGDAEFTHFIEAKLLIRYAVVV